MNIPATILMAEQCNIECGRSVASTDDLTSKSVEQEGRMSLILYISQQSVIEISLCVLHTLEINLIIRV
jgi:hypothetical protein